MKQTTKTDINCIKKILRYIALIAETYNKFDIKNFDDFEGDAVCQLAVTQALTNIYEIQKKIQLETMEKLTLFKSLRYRLKVARNIASHDYESVNFEILYKTTQSLLDEQNTKELETVVNVFERNNSNGK